MASTLERGSVFLPPNPKCRLQFSQGSQPTPSQFLNSAMNNCRLGSQSAMGSQPGAPDDSGLCQSQASVLTSQEYLPGCDTHLQLQATRGLLLQGNKPCVVRCRSQDFITPAEQQYSTAADVAQAGRCMPSPAQLSPNRVKRPRNALGEDAARFVSMHPWRCTCGPVSHWHAAPSQTLRPWTAASPASGHTWTRQAPRAAARTTAPRPGSWCAGRPRRRARATCLWTARTTRPPTPAG